jgi:hypothetical protein
MDRKRTIGEFGGSFLRAVFNVALALIFYIKRIYQATEGLTETQDSTIKL